uniref:Uncharacterized protein n=1 Tax=Globodera pallida TaxID=36090 RepID=A0A183BM64_GLOPA
MELIFKERLLVLQNFRLRLSNRPGKMSQRFIAFFLLFIAFFGIASARIRRGSYGYNPPPTPPPQPCGGQYNQYGSGGSGGSGGGSGGALFGATASRATMVKAAVVVGDPAAWAAARLNSEAGRPAVAEGAVDQIG